MKTIRADFDPGKALTLALYAVGTDIISYLVVLTESLTDSGSYYYIGALITGRYRTALFDPMTLVQRGRVFIGSLDNTTYCIGNWDGEKDVT